MSKETKICSFLDCGAPAIAKGLCKSHYAQVRRGHSLTPIKRKDEVAAECKFQCCTNVVYANKICRPHYRQQLKGEDLHEIESRARKPCTFPGCTKLNAAHGLCGTHYAQQERGSKLHPIGSLSDPNEVVLDEDGCSAWLILTNRRNEEQGRTRIDLEDLEKVCAAGRWCKSGNYALRRSGSLGLHRFLMQEPEGLEVDHIDGCGWDNRKANLRCVTRSQQMENKVRKSALGHRNVIKRGNSYIVGVSKDGKRHYGGSFHSLEEALEVAKTLRAKFFTHVNEDRC